MTDLQEAQQQVEAIELDIIQYKELIDLRDALNRLMDHPDFKKVIRESYFKEEPARLVQIKAAPAMSSEKFQTDILRQLDGIGALQQYFNTIWVMGDQAQSSIEDGHESLVEIESET